MTVTSNDGRGSAIRVLLVEDEAPIQRALARYLRQAGISVCAAFTAEEALAVMDQEPFDVVVTDVGLPGQDGVALMEEIRCRFSGVPVVICSGEAPPRGRFDGAFTAVLKPFRPAILVDAVIAAAAKRSEPLG